MKVYIVWRRETEIFSEYNFLEKVFASKDRAEAFCAERNADNHNPLVRDCYGPLYGDLYVVETVDVE